MDALYFILFVTISSKMQVNKRRQHLIWNQFTSWCFEKSNSIQFKIGIYSLRHNTCLDGARKQIIQTPFGRRCVNIEALSTPGTRTGTGTGCVPFPLCCVS